MRDISECNPVYPAGAIKKKVLGSSIIECDTSLLNRVEQDP
jgi:hypothetical protein